jgi:hypothetical protein
LLGITSSRAIQQQYLVNALSHLPQDVLVHSVILPGGVEVDINFNLGWCAEDPWVLQRDLDRIVNHEDLPVGCRRQQGRHPVRVDQTRIPAVEEFFEICLIHHEVLVILIVLVC